MNKKNIFKELLYLSESSQKAKTVKIVAVNPWTNIELKVKKVGNNIIVPADKLVGFIKDVATISENYNGIRKVFIK